jgi:hypothetical protein
MIDRSMAAHQQCYRPVVCLSVLSLSALLFPGEKNSEYLKNVISSFF